MKMFASAIVALFATVALANPPAAPAAAPTAPTAATAPAVTAPTATTAKAEKAVCAKDDKKCMEKKEAAKKTH